MAHFAAIPSASDIMHSGLPNGYKGSVRNFVSDKFNAVSQAKKPMSGKVALIVTKHPSFLLDRALRSLGVALRSISDIAEIESYQNDVDFVIIGSDVVEHVSFKDLAALRRSKRRIGVIALGRNSAALVESGLVDEAVSGSSLDRQLLDAMAGAQAKARMDRLHEPVRNVRVSAFRQPVKRRRSLFEDAVPVGIRNAA